MSQEEFNKHHQRWLAGWLQKYRIANVDFQTYMGMNGVSEEEFKEKIKKVG